MYTTVLFDLDGTLTDPGLGITNSVAYALAKYNITVDDRSELYKFIGPPLHESFQMFYGFSEEQALQAVSYYREYFSVQGLFENEKFKGIDTLLKEIKASGRKVILATSKPEEYATKILEHFSLSQYFDFIGGASMDGVRCKKADVIAYALERGKVTDFKQTIMIGDREHDILGAKENGIDSIGVLFGYGDFDELTNAGATYIAATIEDIFPLL